MAGLRRTRQINNDSDDEIRHSRVGLRWFLAMNSQLIFGLARHGLRTRLAHEFHDRGDRRRVALAMLEDRHSIAAAFGFAGAVKAWAIVAVLVVAMLCLPHLRRMAVYVAGVAAGFLIPVVPFAVAAPRVFYNDVVVAQLARIGEVKPEVLGQAIAKYRLDLDVSDLM